MIASYTTEDGYTLRVFGTMYLDWGLSISKGDEQLYYSPSSLCSESYGFKPNPVHGLDYDETMDRVGNDGKITLTHEEYIEAYGFCTGAPNPVEAFVEWSDEDWKEALADSADDFIEAYCGDM